MTVNMSDTSNTAGAGVIDSWHQVAISCGEVQQAHGGDLVAVGVELGVNIASAVLDTVALAMDPFSKLIAAGLGWLIEHIAVLKWPLDQVAGNPAEVSKLAEELHKIAESLRNAGDDLDKNLKSMITKWDGAGHDSFMKSINDRKGWIDTNAKAADVAGYMVETTGALISAVRTLIRDIITTVLGDIIATMLIALAAAAFTFGASIAVGVTKCVIATVASVASMMAKLAKAMGFGGRTLARLNKLAESLRTKANGVGHRDIELQEMPGGSHPTTAPHDEGGGAEGTGSTHNSEGTGGEGTGSTHSGDEGGGEGTGSTHEEPNAAGTTHDDPDSTHDGTEAPPPHEPEDPFVTWQRAEEYFSNPANKPFDDADSTHTSPNTTPESTGSTHEDPGTAQNGTGGTHSGNEDSTGTSQTGTGSTQESTGTTHNGDDAGAPPPHQETPTPPPEPQPKKPSSLISGADVQMIKKHESWLAEKYKDAEATRKWVDSWLKKNAPDYYPMLKALSDAKSSKNFVGWGGKTIVQIDRSLTDIESQAQAAWAAEDQNQQQNQQQ